MNLKQALYIKTIAEEGGITAAAKKLYISQPSLSQMLRQVEEAAGVPLFDRSSQPLRLTYAGERYIHAAAQMLAANAALENELQELREEQGGRLRLGISLQRSVYLLPRVLPQFIRDYPHVQVELREAGSAALEQMVLDGEVELALASTEAAAPGLSYLLLQEETIGILAGPDSPLARRLPAGAPITPEETLDAPLVSLKPGHNVRVIQDWLFQSHGLRPRILLETDSMEAALGITAACGCYMLCPNGYTRGGGSFFPLKGYENRRHFYACHRDSQPLTKYMNSFLELVRGALISAGS